MFTHSAGWRSRLLLDGEAQLLWIWYLDTWILWLRKQHAEWKSAIILETQSSLKHEQELDQSSGMSWSQSTVAKMSHTKCTLQCLALPSYWMLDPCTNILLAIGLPFCFCRADWRLASLRLQCNFNRNWQPSFISWNSAGQPI